jgi:hypothetical protein
MEVAQLAQCQIERRIDPAPGSRKAGPRLRARRAPVPAADRVS